MNFLQKKNGRNGINAKAIFETRLGLIGYSFEILFLNTAMIPDDS